MSASGQSRRRNPRGEGTRLRGEIIRAALQLIDDSGAEAVTLRAVARQAGISAPSIYDHFADRDQIISAVIGQCFAELAGAIATARDAMTDPVDRLEAGCHAYLQYAQRHPQRYALLFRYNRPAGAGYSDGEHTSEVAFRSLVDGITHCVKAGRSASTDPFADAVAVWSGLHGLAGLHTAQTGFPWPDGLDTERRIVHGLARIS